jgi:invasion protein IalB
MTWIVRKSLLVTLFSVVLSSAYAQTFQRMTATYDDWMISCVTQAEKDSKKTCEVVQLQGVQGQPNAVFQITISRPDPGKNFKIFFQVPANVWLDTGIKLVTEEGKESVLPSTFRWCIPARCLADAELTEPFLKKLRDQPKPGLVVYKDAAQHDVSIPVSFKGLPQALDAMVKG